MSLLYALCPVPLACFSYYVCPLCKKRNKKAWKVVFLLRWQQRGKKATDECWMTTLTSLYRSFLYKDSAYKLRQAICNIIMQCTLSNISIVSANLAQPPFCILNGKMFNSILSKRHLRGFAIWQSRSKSDFCLSFRVKMSYVRRTLGS